ncbi:MAG: hypothetical protein MUC69_04025 [Gemmatimonadales bacterium]|jgi:aspartokinase-like uncharacterized kinase|nr:hypothetical protein [Gemmatimonadales bacterium]
MPESTLVVKVGGALHAVPGALDDVAEALPRLASCRPVVVVPGGGPFADAVRRAQVTLAYTEATAHWMAILGMDQYAHVLAARIPGAELVEAWGALSRREGGGVVVFAPYRWMRDADPLPHTWEATSDSVAAVVAARLGATDLLLVKATSGTPETLADAFFPRALAPGVAARCVTTAALLALARHAAPGGAPPGAPG